MASNTAVAQCDTLRIYVPYSRRGVADASLALGKARALAGGWTARQVAGGWLAPDGTTVEEPVTEHEFLCPLDKAQPIRKYLIALAEDLLAAGEQAVLVVVIRSTGTTITFTLT